MLKKMNRGRRLRTPGFSVSGQNGLDMKAMLQEAAAAEDEMDQQHIIKPGLIRQNAVEEEPKGLSRQSRSDPNPPPSTFVYNEVKAVQESSDKQLHRGLSTGHKSFQTKESSISENVDDDHYGDGPGFPTDKAAAVSSGRHLPSDSATSSFYLSHGHGGSFTCDKSVVQSQTGGSLNERFNCLKVDEGHTPLTGLCEKGSSIFSKGTDFSYLESQVDSEILRQLETSARCRDSSCHKCAEMRDNMTILQNHNIPAQSSSKEEKILINMHAHSSRCTLSRCPFYWCDLFPEPLSCHREIVAVMKHRVENGALDSFMDNNKLFKFIKLHMNYPKFMKEDEDWMSLTRLGHSRNTVLALPTKQDLQGSLDYWVVKKVIAPAEDGALDKLYHRLLEMKHPGIVQHLWAASFINPDMFVICTKYEGLSLHEVVDAHPIHNLPILVNLMLKLIEILEHLHRQGILFLNWSGSNIIVDQTLTKVKMADFTASTLKEEVEYDLCYLDSYLPVHLHPPELFVHGKLDEKSDVWGLGCLLHEVMTGKPVWHQYQHETLEGLRKKMISEKQPIIPTDVKELSTILRSCLEFEMSKRPILDELKHLLITASFGHERRSSSTINVYQMSNT